MSTKIKENVKKSKPKTDTNSVDMNTKIKENVKKNEPKTDTNSVDVANTNQKNATGLDNWKTFLTSKGKSVEFKTEVPDTDKNCGCVAIDCEMVGIGSDKKTNMLARVSIVNSMGNCLYDTFVKPTAPVTDYRTSVSGVHPEDLKNAERFYVVQQKVFQLIKGKLLVGHAVHNDLTVLKLSHPLHNVRDTSRYKKFNDLTAGTPSLKRLTSHFLQVNIQDGEHNSIQDAQAAMQLYMLHRKDWEAEIRKKRHYYYTHKVKKKPKPTHRPRRMHKNYKK